MHFMKKENVIPSYVFDKRKLKFLIIINKNNDIVSIRMHIKWYSNADVHTVSLSSFVSFLIKTNLDIMNIKKRSFELISNIVSIVFAHEQVGKKIVYNAYINVIVILLPDVDIMDVNIKHGENIFDPKISFPFVSAIVAIINK